MARHRPPHPLARLRQRLGHLARTAGSPRWTRRVLRLVAGLRVVATVLAVPSALLWGRLGDRRLTLALGLVLVALPWNLWVADRLHRRREWPRWTGPVDAVIVAALGSLLPAGAWPLIPVLLTGIVAMEAARAGFAVSATTAVTALAASTVSGLIAGPDTTAVLLVAQALTAVVIVVAVGRLSEETRSTLHRLGAVMDGVPGIVWESRLGEGELAFVSGHVREVLGYAPWEFSARRLGWADLVHPDDQGVFLDSSRVDQMTWPLVREFRIRARDGRWLWLRDTVRMERDGDDGWFLRGVAVDISEVREAERRARRFADIVDRMQTPLFILEMSGDDPGSLVFLRANAAARRWSGPDGRDLAGRRAADVAWFAATALANDIAAVVRTGEPREWTEIPSPIPSRSDRFVNLEIWALDNGCVAMSVDDVTTRVRARADQRRESLHDPLTGLPNRAHLLDRLEAVLTSAADHQGEVALLIVDLDEFKEVNDTLGHLHGDDLLCEVGRRLAGLRRGDDLVARLGGDEFAILLYPGDRQRAEAMAEVTMDLIGRPLELNGLHVQARASLGIAIAPHDATDAHELMQRAEVAMYQAKAQRQGWARYSPGDDRFTLRRLTLLGELPRALDEDQLVVQYQPKIDLTEGRVVGVEALVRWVHPELGMIRPDEFIELTEVAGLINRLTRIVLGKSLEQLREWDRAGIHLDVAVNLSVRNFHDQGLAEFIGSELARNRLDPHRLMLEITESEVMDDVVVATTMMQKLSALGIRTSIDDFGTGNSSLTRLRQLPIDEIKIDRSFVGDMATNQNDAVIVKSIIDLGHNLDLEVVAEGVEDEWTLDNLVTLGCDRAQGYFFQRPVPATDIPRFVGEMDRSRIT